MGIFLGVLSPKMDHLTDVRTLSPEQVAVAEWAELGPAELVFTPVHALAGPLTVEMNLEVGTPKDKLCIRIQRPGFSISRLHAELWGIGDLNLNVALMSYDCQGKKRKHI